MVSKGQFVGLDWNRIARLHSQVLTSTYAVHLRTKINDNKMMFEFQKQDDRRRNHNKQSRNSSI